jgi:hypothetical protein
MRFRKSLIVTISALLFAESATLSFAQAITFNTLALTGTTGTAANYGPGLGSGVGFNLLSTNSIPVIAANGEVAFHATLTGTNISSSNNEGIWSTPNGALTTIAREGTTGPGPNLGAGVIFGRTDSSNTFTNPVINSSGKVAFDASITGTGVSQTSNSDGIWTNSAGPLTVVARTGTAGPGPNIGAGIYHSLLFGDVALDDTGAVTFRTRLGGIGVNSNNLDGTWSNHGGVMGDVLREGDSILDPNVEPGKTFGPPISTPTVNASGQIAVFAQIDDPSLHIDAPGVVIPPNLNGIWTTVGGKLSLLARSGDSGPGPNLGAGINFLDFKQAAPSINSQGTVTFPAHLSGTGIDSTNDQGIWSNSSGSLAAVARTGVDGLGPNLGAGLHFSQFFRPFINSAGQITFRATLTGSGVTTANDNGIWTTTAAGPLACVVREGDSAPNLSPGVLLNNLRNPVIDAAGDIVFFSDLSGTGIDTTNNQALYLWQNGALNTLLRKGDLLDVDPRPNSTDLRTIQSIEFSVYGFTSGGTDSRNLAFSDNGTLAFTLQFTDGSSGVFTAQVVPELNTFLLFASGVAGLVASRFRRNTRRAS